MDRIKFSDIKNDNVEAAEKALNKGAHLELKDALGATPLMRAAYYCALDTARLLISRDSNVNAQDIYKRTPLSWAGLSIFYLEKENRIYVEKRGSNYWIAGPQSESIQKKEPYNVYHMRA